jgi:5'-nucleotidase (lipoprotein e(P4) family)
MREDNIIKRFLAKGPAVLLAAIVAGIIGALAGYLLADHLFKKEIELSLKFDKREVKGLNYASGLVRGRDETFWTVTDKGNRLVRFDAVKGVPQAIEIQFPEDIKAEFESDGLDLEGLTYDPGREVFYVISEANRAVIRVTADGLVTGFFFVEGEDAEHNIGLEGITFDRKQDIIYIVDEGPHDKPKKLYRYDVNGNKIGEPFEIIVFKRITGITYIGDDTFLALNTFKSPEEGLHRIIRFSIKGGLVEEVIDIQKEYPGFKRDMRDFQTNYEGIEVDEQGRIYLINDAMNGVTTNLLIISKEVLNERAHGSSATELQKESVKDDERTLNAILWMHTSAEYRALCLQIYKNALAATTDEVKLRRSKNKEAKLAVVMDLDTTVLDNTRFDLFLLANNLKFAHEIRRDWIARHPYEVSLVPGALNFIKAVESQQVKVIFISNRPNNQKEITFSTLKRLGVFPEDAELEQIEDRLLLREDVRSKEPRRQRVRESFSVVAYVGDNLADFAQEFEAPKTSSYLRRQELVRPHIAELGLIWFVLPNPVYGDWYESLKEEDIKDLLKETKD